VDGEFSWNYIKKEIYLIIEGEAKPISETGERYLIKAGDLVVFLEGIFCEGQTITNLKNF
tara:strand:- start:487 stop:666 length:180 start_codon:yes stop_codon:yes gene_type:complete